MIEIDYVDLPVSIDLAVGENTIHPEAPGNEALFNEADSNFSAGSDATAGAYNPANDATDGSNPGLLNDSTPGTYERGVKPMARNVAEGLGEAGTLFREMSFSIEKTAVTAQSRALKAEYTLELAQDLKAIHGLDAEQELANILSSEILAEINREVVRSVPANPWNSASYVACKTVLVSY